MASVSYPHVVESESGALVIEGTRIKLHFIARGCRAGQGAEEIRRDLPMLTLGQIHSAMAYYFDHKDAMDADLDRRDRFDEQCRAEAGESPLRRKLRDEGIIA